MDFHDDHTFKDEAFSDEELARPNQAKSSPVHPSSLSSVPSVERDPSSSHGLGHPSLSSELVTRHQTDASHWSSHEPSDSTIIHNDASASSRERNGLTEEWPNHHRLHLRLNEAPGHMNTRIAVLMCPKNGVTRADKKRARIRRWLVAARRVLQSEEDPFVVSAVQYVLVGLERELDQFPACDDNLIRSYISTIKHVLCDAKPEVIRLSDEEENDE
mmetsp:Transcript_27654/g.46382  ORF Transcript_27654/g.46382 Transcript_27654/m.46382 type:complete len:216 (+) Transcript_27654:165-812(+)